MEHKPSIQGDSGNIGVSVSSRVDLIQLDLESTSKDLNDLKDEIGDKLDTLHSGSTEAKNILLGLCDNVETMDKKYSDSTAASTYELKKVYEVASSLKEYLETLIGLVMVCGIAFITLFISFLIYVFITA